MNPLSELRTFLHILYPRAVILIDEPLHNSGVWFLDLDLDEIKLVIEWSEEEGFGVSKVDNETGYGEGPEEIFSDLGKVKSRVTSILNGRETRS